MSSYFVHALEEAMTKLRLLREEVARLQTEKELILGVLLQLEWSQEPECGGDPQCCPACGESGIVSKHDEDCFLSQAIELVTK